MSRALVAACLLVAAGAGPARSDGAEASMGVLVAQLGGDGSARIRLTAALALSKTHEPRAVIALAGAVERDDDASIRRIAALALERVVDARTAPDAFAISMRALRAASMRDPDASVRSVAARALKTIEAARRPQTLPAPALARTDKPEIFVNIDATHDQSNHLPPGGGERLMRIVKSSIEQHGYSTSWPGGLPTGAELAANRSRGFIVASTVKAIEITRLGSQTQVACTVAVRIAPWNGRDGGERWEANRAASASGSAKAMTGNRDRDVAGGVRDCIEAVTEDVTARQVMPFLKRLAAGS